jgi:YbgC/YbaW family acyl-CoA thioester hydrolase
VNNARYLTYLEQGRIAYITHLGLWKGPDLIDVGVILADAHLIFRAPIRFGQALRVGVQVTRLGNKSLEMAYRLEDSQSGLELAIGTTVLVAYDYRLGQSIPIPAEWRTTIQAFERWETADRSDS